MSTFDNKLLKTFILKYTTTHQCSHSENVKYNSYLTSPSIHNDTTSDNFITTPYEVDVQSIHNYWEDYATKYGEEHFNSHNNRSTQQTLKQHAHKSNEILYRKKSLVKQCVLINEFLNKGELSTNCLFIGMYDADINSQFYPMQKIYFMKRYHQKSMFK